jgi:hypothetical protein
MLRFGVFFILTLLILSVPLWVALLLVGLYALRWFGLELIVLGFAIDVTFGTYQWPLYTIGAVLIVAFVEWWKPTLSVY